MSARGDGDGRAETTGTATVRHASVPSAHLLRNAVGTAAGTSSPRSSGVDRGHAAARCRGEGGTSPRVCLGEVWRALCFLRHFCDELNVIIFLLPLRARWIWRFTLKAHI